MALPFLEKPVPEELAGAGSKIDEYEAYHILMRAYPGYTVRTIEDELSWREIGELINQWEKYKPMSAEFESLSKVFLSIAKKKYGVKLTKRGNSEDRNIENELVSLGWL